MPSSLTIPNGSPVRWIIEVGAGSGSINEGAVLRNNSAWPGDESHCGIYFPDFCQPFDCTDTTMIQIVHENTDDPEITLELVRSEDDFVMQAAAFTTVSGNFKQATIDFANATCGDCHYLRLTTLDCKAVNLFPCGDSGNFETPLLGWGVSTGGNNTIAVGATAHQGVQSAQITANAAPTPGSATALYCTSNLSLVADAYYCMTAWVYDDNVSPWTQDFEEVYLSIETGFADATVLYETRVTPSEDGRGQWHQIALTFRTGAATTGSIRIISDSDPRASGDLFIDEIRLFGTSDITEATTEPICVENLDPRCFKRILYYGDKSSHGFYYNRDVPGDYLENFIRVEFREESQRYEDPDFLMHTTSGGSNILLASQLLRIYQAATVPLPPWFHEKIIIALKHEHFFINDLEYKPLEGPYQPDYPQDYAMGIGEFEIVDSEYDQQYTFTN